MAEPIMIPGGIFDDLEPMPITPAWIRRGAPIARGKLLTDTPDKLAYIVAWECSPGEFAWHYAVEEETIYFIEGEVFISVNGAPEQRLGPGDVALFTPGTSTVWRVTRSIRKLAILRKHMPLPLGVATRAWNKLLRGISGFTRPAAAHAPVGLVRS